jgi:hypothetical protein
MALTWPTDGSRSVGIVRLQTKAKEFSAPFTYYIVEKINIHMPGILPSWIELRVVHLKPTTVAARSKVRV